MAAGLGHLYTTEKSRDFRKYFQGSTSLASPFPASTGSVLSKSTVTTAIVCHKIGNRMKNRMQVSRQYAMEAAKKNQHPKTSRLSSLQPEPNCRVNILSDRQEFERFMVNAR